MTDLPDWMATMHSRVVQPRSPVQTAIQAPAIPYRNAPRNRPPPRQMRPAEQRAMDPNAGVRRQALGRINRREGADLATMPRVPRGNQFAEAGSMALEATGLPQVRRGAETLTNVARAPYQPNAPMRALSGVGELGLGVLGAATFGEVGAMRPRSAPAAPRPAPPPRTRRAFDDPNTLTGRIWNRMLDDISAADDTRAYRQEIRTPRPPPQPTPQTQMIRELSDADFASMAGEAQRALKRGELDQYLERIGPVHPDITEELRYRAWSGNIAGQGPGAQASDEITASLDQRINELTPANEFSAPPLTRPPTQIAPNGMPIRPPQPFRNSLRGGNDDLAEAANFGRAPQGEALPMDEASRMTRAQEMGFDTEAPLYHGTDQNIDAFRTNDGWYGNGVYASRSPQQAEYYTRRTPAQASGGQEPAPNIMPLVARGRLAPVEEYQALVRENMPRGKWTKAGEDNAVRQAQAELQRRGYGGIDAGGLDSEVVVFNPSDVRSRFAAFDPARSGEANLLAGAGGLGLTGMFAARENRQ